MKAIAQPLEQLIEELKHLPGIGPKSAQRLAFHLLRQPESDVERLAQTILTTRTSLHSCSRCHNLTDQEECHLCTSTTRNRDQICLVETAQDILSIEKTGDFDGLYHVLGGALSPLHGVGPEQLNIQSLLTRLQVDNDSGTQEIIVATNPNAEGEATALYLAKLLKPLGVRVTRLAMGLPAGSELGYTDSITMSRALEGRREL